MHAAVAASRDHPPATGRTIEADSLRCILTLEAGMMRCSFCDYPMPDDSESVGARCPACHYPLHDPVDRVARFARAGAATCALHPAMERVASCAHCRKNICETCRTRWRGRSLCVACAEAALALAEASPDEIREKAAARQAFASVILGGGAWLTASLVVLYMRRAPAMGDAAPRALFLGLVALFGLSLVAAVGMGQAVAALRARAAQSTLAAAGLCLGGLYVGVLFGLGTLSLWQG